MIYLEREITAYLRQQSDLVTLLGGMNKICSIQPPADLQMPWLLIETTTGPVVRMGSKKQQETNIIRLCVDSGSKQMADGKKAIEMARDYLQGLRGTMGTLTDFDIKFNTTGGFPGLDGAYRWFTTGTVIYMAPFQKKIYVPST